MSLYSFSATQCLFYSNELRTHYDSLGAWPFDAIDIDDDISDVYLLPPHDGKQLGVDDAGQPAWVDKPPLTKNQLIQIAESEKQNRLLNAQQTISLWQTQLQLGMISDSNKQKLIEWIEYIEAVQAVDTNTAQNIIWPVQPAE